MKDKQIVITDQDMHRLRALIHDSRTARSETETHLAVLERELDRAVVVGPQEVPADVVTMNSTVKVKVDRLRLEDQWTIVYPAQADIETGRISVLSPLGTALLGYRVGDTLEWQVPAGRRKYRVTGIVYQPEAACAWDL